MCSRVQAGTPPPFLVRTAPRCEHLRPRISRRRFSHEGAHTGYMGPVSVQSDRLGPPVLARRGPIRERGHAAGPSPAGAFHACNKLRHLPLNLVPSHPSFGDTIGRQCKSTALMLSFLCFAEVDDDLQKRNFLSRINSRSTCCLLHVSLI